MSFDKIETKWNADEEKLKIIMGIEKEITYAFINYNLEDVYTLLRAYRIHATTKFKQPIKDDLTNELNKISELLEEHKKVTNPIKKIETKKKFIIKSEEYFIKISSLLKEAGVYYREGKGATTAILQR